MTEESGPKEKKSSLISNAACIQPVQLIFFANNLPVFLKNLSLFFFSSRKCKNYVK